MKNRNYILFLAFILLFSCQKSNSNNSENATGSQNQNKKNMRNNILYVDLNKNYPEKDKIYLQDFAEVKYISLETTNDFLCSGSPVYIDDEIIIFTNNRAGDILIFDSNGKTKKRINRKGASGEEYAGLSGLAYDKKNDELFVNDMFAKKIVVYDLTGNYKRHFYHQQNTQYRTIVDFDDNNLLCHTAFHSLEEPFILVSKETGKKEKNIPIPFEKQIDPDIKEHLDNGGMQMLASPVPYIVKNGNQIILNEVSSDTIYQLNQDATLSPLLVRTDRKSTRLNSSH